MKGWASLYEQCGEVSGHIHGFTNWRLPGLQRAIKSGSVPSFKSLTATTPTLFITKIRRQTMVRRAIFVNYLQEKELLIKFYQEFQGNQKTDPTGFKSLQKILGETDMEAFKSTWEKFVFGFAILAGVEGSLTIWMYQQGLGVTDHESPDGTAAITIFHCERSFTHRSINTTSSPFFLIFIQDAIQNDRDKSTPHIVLGFTIKPFFVKLR